MNAKSFYLILLIVIFGVSRSFAQYQVVLKNDTLVTDSQYDFDIFIKSESGKINLTSYQIVLTVNDSIAQSGGLTFTYINGSSQLTNIPDVNIGLISDDGKLNLAVGSSHSDDTVSATFVKVGRFRVSNTSPFGNHRADIGWDFNGFVKSEVNLNDSNKTNPSNYSNLLTNPVLIISGITDNKVNLNEFRLSQNYPNPFNPTTNIEFVMPKQAKATLMVYNILGEKVATLLDQTLNAGTHTVQFNGGNLASGTYVYVLQVDDQKTVRKMLLLK